MTTVGWSSGSEQGMLSTHLLPDEMWREMAHLSYSNCIKETKVGLQILNKENNKGRGKRKRHRKIQCGPLLLRNKWRGSGSNKKQPGDRGEPFCLAVFWDRWHISFIGDRTTERLTNVQHMSHVCFLFSKIIWHINNVDITLFPPLPYFFKRETICFSRGPL